MTLIQYLIIAFAAFALVRAVRQYQARKIILVWLAFWVVFWLFVVTVAILPESTNVLARFVGVGRGADAVIYTALILLFFLFFRALVRLEELESEISRLARHLALRDADLDSEKD